MKSEILFDRFSVLGELPEEKKQQVYSHFKTAPDWVLDCLSVISMPADVVFIREGQPAGTVFMIASGAVKGIEYRILGIQYEFIHFTSVYSLGGMEAIMDLPFYKTTLKTIENCVVIQISRANFEKWIMSDIAALKYESKLMGEYLLEQGRLARELIFLPGPQRLAKLLLRKYEKYAVDGLLRTKSTRQELVNETGFNIKTVSRAIKTLEDGGYITKGERSITVNYEQYLSLKHMVAMTVAPDSEI